MFLLACGSLRANQAVMFFAFVQCLQSLHFSLSFLSPCIQPLSAPHTRVAHSVHSTIQSQFYFTIHLQFNAWYLLKTSNYQIRKHALQLIIVSFHAKQIVSFRSFATLAFPDLNAKNHASPAVNGSCLSPSYFELSIHHPCSTRRRLALQ